MIELNTRTIWLLGGRQRNIHGRIFLVGVIEKENFVRLEAAGQEGIPELPDGLPNRADGEQVINRGHSEQLRQAGVVADPVNYGKRLFRRAWFLKQ